MITKTKFDTYESIRESGITNMFDVGAIVTLSGGELDKKDCLEIMEGYSEFEAKFEREEQYG